MYFTNIHIILCINKKNTQYIMFIKNKRSARIMHRENSQNNWRDNKRISKERVFTTTKK